MTLQHQHFDVDSNSWIGEEHRLEEWPLKCVDGYNAKENIIFEYFGSDVHGHPRLWEHNLDRSDRVGRNMQNNYVATFEKMSKLKTLGYRVLYLWDRDVDRKTGKSFLPEVFREFTKDLEW